MHRPSRSRPLWRLLAGGLLAAGALAAQLAEITETIEVRVVNVDVVVTDDRGTVVRGLEAGDFELRVEGRPVEVEYFNVVDLGRPSTGGVGDAQAPPPTVSELQAVRPFLVIAYDGRRLRPAQARQAVESLRDRLHELIAASRGIMVVRLGMSLVVEQPLGRDLELLDAALARLVDRQVPALDLGGRNLLMRRLESAMPLRMALADDADEEIAEHARRMLHDVRSQAEVERFEMESASGQLIQLVGSLAGLPGRKAILYLGDGFRTMPAEPLFRVWWDLYSRWAPDLGIPNLESEMASLRSDRRLVAVVDQANSHRVSFYTFDPAGLRAIGGGARFSSLGATSHLANETEEQLESLLALARSTGGVGRIDTGSIDPLVGEMLAGFGTYYSLGFDPGERAAGRVEVRVRAPGLRVRYLDRFTVLTPRQQLAEATVAALFTDSPENRLDVGVELGRAERQDDGTYLVPLLVKVPIARLSLLPREASHVGRLSVVIIAQSGSGVLSEPAHAEVPIEIANRELLGAMGRQAGYRLQMRVAAGEQKIAIGVRDEVARQDATLSLVLDPERDA